MQLNAVTFALAKQGNEEREWEDGAAFDPGDAGTGRLPRIAVADGATTGIGSARWAERLAAGFAAPDGSRPALEAGALDRWVCSERVRWAEDPHWAAAGAIALHKMQQLGTLATFLGCELRGLAQGRPRWDACAVGDTVLFHVRDAVVVQQFPPMEAEDFGVSPDGITTRDGAIDGLLTGGGELAPDDLLFVATDALAEWITRVGRRNAESVWDLLAGIDDPHDFAEFVAAGRLRREMTNDDVTLTRLHLTRSGPDRLLVYR